MKQSDVYLFHGRDSTDSPSSGSNLKPFGTTSADGTQPTAQSPSAPEPVAEPSAEIQETPTESPEPQPEEIIESANPLEAAEESVNNEQSTPTPFGDRDSDQSVGAVNRDDSETETSLTTQAIPKVPSVPPSEPTGESVNNQQLTVNRGDSGMEALSPKPTVELEQKAEERIEEKVTEKLIRRELNEDEQTSLFNSRLKTLSTKGNRARTEKRKAAYEQILAYLREYGFATNNEIQKHCNIGDSTTTRYLRELEKQGLVVKVGRTRGVRWRFRQGNQ